MQSNKVAMTYPYRVGSYGLIAFCGHSLRDKLISYIESDPLCKLYTLKHGKLQKHSVKIRLAQYVR